MSHAGLHEILDVPAVMRRYGIRDPRAARKVMHDGGGFLVAGRLVIRVDDLATHEEALKRNSRGGEPQDVAADPRPARRRRAHEADQGIPPPEFWRDAPLTSGPGGS